MDTAARSLVNRHDPTRSPQHATRDMDTAASSPDAGGAWQHGEVAAAETVVDDVPEEHRAQALPHSHFPRTHRSPPPRARQ